MRRGKNYTQRIRDTRVSQRYHSISKQSRRRSPARNYGIDWGADWRQPKSYGLADRVLLNLPREDFIGSSALSLLSPRAEQEGGAESFSNDSLASLLYFGYGVTCSRSHGSAIYRLRAAPSAGAVYPTELYLVAGDLGELPAGIYHYSPEDFSLELLHEGDSREAAASICAGDGKKGGRFYLVFTSMCRRTEARFGRPGYRYCLLDGGHVIGNFLALLDRFDCRAFLRGSFDDRRLYGLLGLEREEEAILAVLQVGDEECKPGFPVLSSERDLSADLTLSRERDRQGRSLALRVHDAGSLVTEGGKEVDAPSRKSGSGDVQGEAAHKRLSITEQMLTGLDGKDIGEVLGGRRTTRRFAGEAITEAELAVLTECSAAPYEADWLESQENKDGIDLFAQAELFVAANNVRGLEPGIYRIDRVRKVLAAVGRAATVAELTDACMGQKQAVEAAAVIFVAPRLGEHLERFGNRGYRYAGIHAGIVGERIYLAATALGLGVSGIAGLDDDLVNRLCGIDGEETAVIYALAVGRPLTERLD